VGSSVRPEEGGKSGRRRGRRRKRGTMEEEVAIIMG